MQITDQQIKDFYIREGEHHYHYQNQVYSKPWSQKRFNDVCLMLDKFANNESTLLEVGCAEGLYIDHFLDKGGKSAMGIDISEAKISRANKRDNAIYKVAMLENMTDFLKANQFTVVLATEVIEHMRNPRKLIEDCLTVGNYLIATVPIDEQPLKNPMEIQGHLQTFRMNTFLDLFKGYSIEYSHNSVKYGFAIVKK